MAEQVAPKQVMATQKVTIKLRGSNLTPPIYVVGSFTKEPWSPVEMDVEGCDGENGKMTAITFYKTFNLEPGEYQYKFQLGNGDWWVCDEHEEIVKDDSGNSNNRLVVLPIYEEGVSASKSVGMARNPLQEVNTSNYWLPTIISPQLDHLPEHGTVANKDIPLLSHEMVVGTWQPDQELSSGHRRASTSLGVRISRMGTFIRPSDEEAKEMEGLTDEEFEARNLERCPVKQEDIIANMEEMADKATADKAIKFNDSARFDASSDTPLECVQTASTNSTKPRIKGKGRRQFVSSLDSILEVPQETFQPAPVGGYLGTSQNSISNLGLSYGTMTTESSKNTIGEHVGAQYVPDQDGHPASPAPAPFLEPTNTHLTADGQSSDRLSDSITEHKGEEDVGPADAPKGFVLFATVAAWFRSVWRRLFGGPEKNQKAKDGAQH